MPGKVRRYQPGSRQLGRPHPGAPCSPFGRVQCIVLRKIVDGQIHEFRFLRGLPIGAAAGEDILSVSAAPGGFALGIGVVADVHVEQQLPFFWRPPPRCRPSERVAGTARGPHGGDWIDFVGDFVLRHVQHRLGFFRREAMTRTQRLDDLTRLRGRQPQAVRPHHAPDHFLPSFRSGALPGNAA